MGKIKLTCETCDLDIRYIQITCLPCVLSHDQDKLIEKN
jgi:hypothetical protein